MEFFAEQAATHLNVEGKVYSFCADRCRRLFQEHPHWYVPVQETTGKPHA
jgi:YHS domain-containing protein